MLPVKGNHPSLQEIEMLFNGAEQEGYRILTQTILKRQGKLREG
jgi:hypothetical protein